MPTVNATHRRRLARALAAQQGITYMAALDIVTRAATAGRLPARLDEAGMQAALRLLADEEATPDVILPEHSAVTSPEEGPVHRVASDPRDQPIWDLSFEYEQITGQQGLLYITSPDGKADKYVFGGGFEALGRKEALAHIETLVADAKLLRGGGERYYLIPEALRLLRQVWQGRVILAAVGWDRKRARFTIDDKPASDISDLHLRWLHKHHYVEATLSPGEDWTVARTTEFGDEVLARNGADRDKFRDGLPEPTVKGSTVSFADIQRCPIKSLEAGHYRPDGTCECAPAAIPFDVTGTTRANVRGLLRVRDTFVKAGRVEWWWHTGPFAGSHGFKTVERVDEEAGSLILRDEDPNFMEPRTTLTLDFIDDPDKAARHLIWPDHTGVTFCDQQTGALDATYRVAARNADPEPDARDAAKTVHKARPNAEGTHCAVCLQRIKRVPGGQGTTWIHTDSGAVAAPGGDPASPPPGPVNTSTASAGTGTGTGEPTGMRPPSSVFFAHEGNPVPRCTASSWRGNTGKRAGNDYGPGRFNRCVKRARHESERHIDEWGNVFETDPKFRVLYNVTQGEVARVAAKEGMVLLDAAGNPIDPDLLDEIYPYKATSPDALAGEVRARLRQNQLVQTRTNEVLKVSEIENESVTAQVLYPLPPRTTVRRYSYVEAATWREPSDAMVTKYERAWGFTN